MRIWRPVSLGALACWCWLKGSRSKPGADSSGGASALLPGDYHRDGYSRSGVGAKSRAQPGVIYYACIPWPEYRLHLTHELYTCSAEQKSLNHTALQRHVSKPLQSPNAGTGVFKRRYSSIPESKDRVGVQECPNHFTRPSNAASPPKVLQGLNHEVEPGSLQHGS